MRDQDEALRRRDDAEVDLFEALIAARQSGDHRQITAALGAAPAAALWGPSPVPKAGGEAEHGARKVVQDGREQEVAGPPQVTQYESGGLQVDAADPGDAQGQG